MRTIKCINDDNVAITFGEEFSPFLLRNVDGLYSVGVSVNSKENTMSDGNTYVGSNIAIRNIVLTVSDKDNHVINREYLYQLFKPKAKGTLIYYENDGVNERERAINYYVEKIDIDSINRVRTATISLLCMDPYFTDVDYTTVVMTSWSGLFEFEHEFSSNKEKLGEYSQVKMVTITNNSGVDGIGLIINFKAESTVINPKMILVETGEFIQVGTSDYPFQMEAGDILTICSETNNKNVFLEHNGTTTNVNNYLDEDSDYIQLKNGSNTLRYTANTGEDYLLVSISFKSKYLGA